MIDQLLASLRKENIHISLKENDLKIKFNGTKLPEHLVKEIKANKQALVAYLKANESSKEALKIPVLAPSEDGYPLSSPQSRLWVLCQFEEASVAYNMSFSTKLTIEDESKFVEAIHATMDRHEILRTVFGENKDGEVRQFIQQRADMQPFLQIIDLHEEKNAESIAQQYMVEDVKKPFDFRNGPLLRAMLIRVSATEYMFYYNMHHIICDGWSMNVIANDVITYYQAFLQGSEATIQPLSIQYKDYASWQISRKEDASFEVPSNYWKEKLSGELPRLTLPFEKPRPKMKSFNGKSVGVTVPKSVSTNLQKIIKENGGSLFMLLVSGLQATLHKYTNENDIILGTPVSGRDHYLLENQIGFYLNLLVFRSQIDTEENFTQFYQRVKEDMIQSFEHQNYPFDVLLETLEVDRNPGRNPIFDILVDYHGEAGALHAVEQEGIVSTKDLLVKYDLEFHFYEVENTIQFLVNFNTDIYDETVIKNLATHYIEVLKHIGNQETIGNIDFRTEDEKATIATFEQGKKVALDYQNIIENFTALVETNTEAIALQFEDTSLTYAELDALSNQIAYGLTTEYDVQSGDVVALHFDTNHTTVAAILAILKAGATYTFVDTNLPLERKYFILENAAVKLVITETNYMFDLENYDGNLFSIDVELNEEWSTASINNITENSTAYIIYTSGSTGVPKGVRVGHTALMNYLQWAKDCYGNEHTVPLNFGLFTTLSFDLTVTSLFLPFTAGNALKVIPKGEILEMLQEYVQSELECIKLTPAHIDLLSDFQNVATKLQTVIVGGDVLHPHHVEILRNINPEIAIYNEYGPTETTVGCSIYKVKNTSYNAVPIGKPVYNTKIQVLNDALTAQPIGVAGELYVSGTGLAEGYHGLDTLTSERFITTTTGERLYKTGDLARWTTNGELDYLGRIDNQVKLRGYRIETDEIISNLLKKESIQQAVVLIRETESKEKELVAYITASKEENASDIRTFLADKLPQYMIPEHFIQLEEIPLTKNGKVDRSALQELNNDGISTGIEYVAPEDALDFKLVALWEEVLQREKIGMLDDFFTLGGNSLSAIKLVNAYQKDFQTKISLTDIFVKSTLKDHKELIAQTQNKEEAQIETFEF
ncbi:amino acid adenylation domain-containing protein [Kordia periserrulae]|uniref:Amino acid adenylation domain-containing protein n=1 Tax=Kordia periserrulae TaxID=701523 RepID=A0A2T6BZF2_9FLAO|nr:non-ribosomal peptide synthetase [Kordia periserrulae]PTX61367.1 amino acid adenylation domain-containing protein [Kordia periserrulae]